MVDAKTIMNRLAEDKEFIGWYAGKNEEVEDAEESCRQLAENGEHPEWHTAEMARDGLSSEVVLWGYDHGFARLAVFQYVLVAEAKWNQFSTNQSVVRDFAKELGFQLGTFVNVRFETIPNRRMQ